MSDRTDDEALVEQWYDDEERTALLRYLQLSKGEEFSLAAAEVPSPAVRTALLRWLRARVPDRPLLEVSLKRLAGVVLVDEIAEAIAHAGPCPPQAVIVLTDLESVRGAASESHPSLFMRLNVERDPLVQALPYACLLLAHPAALLKLSTVAPDFCHFFSTRIHHRRLTDLALPGGAAAPISFGPSPSAQSGLSDPDWPTLLRAADLALNRSEFDRARDLLSEFHATPEIGAWEAECRLLEGAVDGAAKGARAGLAALAGFDPDDPTLRPALVVRWLLKQSELHNTLGERQASEAQLDAAQHVADRVGRRDLIAAVLVQRASRVAMDGAIAEALALLEQARAVYEACGRTREAWYASYRTAELRGMRGEWDDALALCEQVLLPLARTQLNDDRLVALARGLQANALQARGKFDEALRVYREQLPVFERLGDERTRANMLSRIADILQRRGDFDEALRIRREEEMPVYQRLGDVRARSIALGRIADVLQSRGDLDEALRIRRDEVLPVTEQFGDALGRAATLGKIADSLRRRGDVDEAIQVVRDQELPVYEQLGLHHRTGVARSNLGSLLSQRGAHASAISYLNQALRDFERSDVVPEQILTRLNLATTLWRSGDKPGALREAQAAVSKAEEMGEPSFELRSVELLVTLLLTLRRAAEAREVWARAATRFAADGRSQALKQLDALLPLIDRVAAPPQPQPPARPRRR